MLPRRRLLAALSLPALTACAQQAAEISPTAAPTSRPATVVPPTPSPVPPTPTPEPTPTPAPEPEEWSGNAWRGKVEVLPKRARQGQTLVLRVWSTQAQTVTANIENRNVELVREGNAFVGLFGIHRQARLGPRPLRFTLADPAGRRVSRSDPADTVDVIDAEFSREELVVDAKTLALLDPVKMNQEDAQLNAVMGKWTPERLWRGPWAEPMVSPAGPVPLSSDFGILRSINGGPFNWSHEGTDYEVDTGDPIRAVAAGRVVFTQEMYVRGNTVVIDHGWGVFSMYNHMFKFDVQPGQDVKKGDVIALVGSTGFVTGPHLHVEIRIHNVPVEPLEWFQREPFSHPSLAAL